MNKLPQLRNIIIPAALVGGLLLGMGAGYLQIKKEQKVFQEKLKEANKRAAYFQQKMEEQKNEAMVSLEQKEQQCRSDLDKLQAVLQNERKTLGTQLEKLQEQTHVLELKAKEKEDAFAKTKQELQVTERRNNDLEQELKKTTSEKNAFQTDLKKTARDLEQCSSNNAELCMIAGDLVKKYKNKGIGAAILEKEPLTQIRKVELEQFVRDYGEEIERLKVKKNDTEGKHVSE